LTDRLADFADAWVAQIIGTSYRVNAVMADRVNRPIAAAPDALRSAVAGILRQR
jgi:hypothetical protein